MSKQFRSLDDKFQCRIHERYNDPDWVNFKKSLVRAPQIIRQTINIGSQVPKHKEFEEYYQKFVQIDENIHSLALEITKYHGYTQTYLKKLISFTDAFTEVVSQSFDDSDEYSASSIRDSLENEGNLGLAVKLAEELKVITSHILPNLDLLLNSVRDPAEKITNITKEIKRNFKVRDFVILDVNKYQNKQESLKERTSHAGSAALTVRQEENLVRYEKNLELSKLKYEELNDQFLQDLSRFFTMVSQLMKPLSVTLFYIQLSIYYSLNRICDIPEQLFALRAKDRDLKPGDYFDDVAQKFRRSHSIVEEIVGKLTITKSKEELHLKNLHHLRHQQNDIDEFPHKDINSEAVSSIITNYQYCYAKYDFVPQEHGDLALKKGDKIKILDKRSDAEWWKGVNNGKVGMFPKIYTSF